MVTITLKVSESDKLFMQAMAKFEGVTLSELIRKRTIESLEEEYDMRMGDLAYQEYLNDIQKGEKTLTLSEMAEELGIDL